MENVFIRDESNTFKDLVADQSDTSNVTIIAKTGFIAKKKLFKILIY